MLKRLLVVSRYLLVVPIIGSLLLTVGVVVMGLGITLTRGWDIMQSARFSEKDAKLMSVTVIQTIDLFLVGAIGYITAVGIHRLFISQEQEHILKSIKIESLNDLEGKIIGVVVAALAVGFLGHAVEAADAQTVLHAGVGTALVIAALCLFMKFGGLTSK